MLERTVVFVDTSYLLASFYNSWEIGARAQLEIDLPEVVATLGNMIESQLGHPVHRQNWYDGIPDTGPHRYQRALRTCDGVQLRTGQLIEWGERRTQKAVDTRLVADMVVGAMNKQVTDFVLVSGDADMIPGVQEATNNGIRVHLYGFGWDSMSSALRHACDSTTILDPREDFSDAMELQVLEGPLPPTVRQRAEGDGAAEGAGTEGDIIDPCEEPSEVEAALNSQVRKNVGTHAASESAVEPALAPTGRDNAAPSHAAADTTAETRPAAPATPTAAASAGTTAVPTPNTVAPSKPGPKPGPPAGSATEHSNAGKLPEAAAGENSGADSIADADAGQGGESKPPAPKPGPKPSMMAPRRKLRSRYVPLPEEVWTSAGFQTPYDVGQQYASWWFDNAATSEQRDSAHLLSGGGLPPEIDRPLLQFACETLHEYTLSESQRVNLRDGFHSGIRGVLINIKREL